MRILIATPTSRFIENETFYSIYKQNVPEGVELDFMFTTNYAVDTGRNILARYAIEHEFDYIFWVDADIVLPEDALEKLISHNKDIVSGSYAMKALGKAIPIAMIRTSMNKYASIRIDSYLGHKGLIKLDCIGFGCVLTKVEIFKKMKTPYFKYTETLGEDAYFCRRAQKLGYEIYIDNTILCGHKGEISYTIHRGEDKE